MCYSAHEFDFHQQQQVKHLFDYAVHQQGFCKTEALLFVAEEMGISELDMLNKFADTEQ